MQVLGVNVTWSGNLYRNSCDGIDNLQIDAKYIVHPKTPSKPIFSMRYRLISSDAPVQNSKWYTELVRGNSGNFPGSAD